MSNQQENDLMLDVGQANEFKLACRKAGLTNADVKTLSSAGILARLLPVLRGDATTVRTTAFPVWQKILVFIGNYTVNDMIGVFDNITRMSLSDDVVDVLCRHVSSQSYEKVIFDTVLITGYDLGFACATSHEKILQSAKSLGLEVLSWLDALHVRLQYKGISDEEIYVGMQSLFIVDKRYEVIFKLVTEGLRRTVQDEHITRSMFRTDHICKSEFHPSEKWIFIQPSE